MAELHGLTLRDLIATCSENGVSEFMSGDLKITFNRWPTVASKNTVQLSTEGVESARIASTAEELDDLLIQNPSAYEDALLQAENEE